MFYSNRVEKIIIFLFALNLCGEVMGGDILKDDNIDRGSRSDRGGLWFGPRLGKRSLRLVDQDNRQTFLRLLEAADALKYYYDQLSYESQADDPEMKVTKKVIFTPKLGRNVDSYAPVNFTPRLGRRLADDRVTPADEDNYRPDVEEMDRRKYFSPRLGRTMNFSPRLGRELSYGYIALIVSMSSGHVLFAADVEELRNLARKLVPGNFAEKLIEIMSHDNAKYNNNNNNKRQFDDSDGKEDILYSYEYEEDNTKEPWHDEKYPSKPITRLGNVPNSETVFGESIDAKQSTDNAQRPKPMEVNLDDLVEKVRQRLLDDFQKNPSELQKLLTAKGVTVNLKDTNNQTKNTGNLNLLRDRNKNQQNRPTRQKILRLKSSKIERKDAQGQWYKDDDLPEVDADGNVRVPMDQRQKNEPEFIFQEVDLNSKKKEKDSYEDYVTPKREDNLFISEESETITKQARSSPRWILRSKQTQMQDIFNYKLQNGIQASSLASNPRLSVSSINPSISDDSNETTTEADLRARTENLWFDYKDEPNPKVIQVDVQAPSMVKPKKVKLGTMIPTRETYKMTSPNYYAQLPTVAEKYNFDEPIPEKDREREDLKPIGNPPSNINGKIKV